MFGPKDFRHSSYPQTFKIWKQQSRISEWTFSLDYIRDLYPDLGAELEYILNQLYKLTLHGFEFDRGYIWFIRSDSLETSETVIRLDEHPSELAEEIMRKCETYGLSYDEKSILVALYLSYLDAILKGVRTLLKSRGASRELPSKDQAKDIIVSLGRLGEILMNKTLYTDPSRLREIYDEISEKVSQISNVFRADLSGK